MEKKAPHGESARTIFKTTLKSMAARVKPTCRLIHSRPQPVRHRPCISRRDQCSGLAFFIAANCSDVAVPWNFSFQVSYGMP
jgi:hypothetical protein